MTTDDIVIDSAAPSTPNTHSIPLKIGVNVQALFTMLDDPKGIRDTDPMLYNHLMDLGVHHWPAHAAKRGGVIEFEVRRDVAKTDRCYTSSPWHIQGIKKGSGLRAAFTSPYEGEVLIDLDWKNSAWQFLAFRSGDAALQQDMQDGDLYEFVANQVPEANRPTRAQAKTAMNTVLNGGGIKALTSVDDPREKPCFDSESAAEPVLKTIQGLLETRWATAKAKIEDYAAEAVSQRWVSKDKRYAGAGTKLMRLEAEALWKVMNHAKVHDLGVRMVLPMHDGALVSAPKEKADEIASTLAKYMAIMATGRKDQADHASKWVKWEVSAAWGGDTAQLLGQNLRVEATKMLNRIENAKSDESFTRSELVVALAAKPADFAKAATAHHHSSKLGRQLKAAQELHKAAESWVKLKTQPATDSTTPIVELDYPDQVTYSGLCRIFREDKALPELWWNERESCAYIGEARAEASLVRKTYLPMLESRYGFLHTGFDTLFAAVTDAALDNKRDPVRDYFDSLTWDGEARVRTWLMVYAGGQDLTEVEGGPPLSGLYSAYATKWMLSVVARAYEPGCKVDTMLVLMGDQGAMKSTLLKTIAPPSTNGKASFGQVVIDPKDKDSVLRVSKHAIAEWSEMAGLSKREQDSIKGYLSQEVDEIRAPYERGDMHIPRRVVFAATTNEDDILRDTTGSRRYWPIPVGKIDIQSLQEDRDQLWAEAVMLYKKGKAANTNYLWWLSPAEDALRERHAVRFTAENSWNSRVLAYASVNGWKVHVPTMLNSWGVSSANDVAAHNKQVIASLKQLKFVLKTVRNELKVPQKMWVAPDSLAQEHKKNGDMAFGGSSGLPSDDDLDMIN